MPNKVKKKPKEEAHAPYSPSAAKRWMNCAGSWAKERALPEPPEGEAAKEGTLTHTCLETFLHNGLGKWLATKRFLLSGGHPPERVENALFAAREIWKLSTVYDGPLRAEKEASLRHIHKDFWGTLDASIVEVFGWLVVVDYKNGRIPVEVEENEQLIAYALAEAHAHHFNFVGALLVIIQPNHDHDDGPVRSWEISMGELAAWEDKFRKAIAATQKKDAPLKAGSWCDWCKAKAECPALYAEGLKKAKELLPDLDTGEETGKLNLPVLAQTTVTTKKLGALLTAAKNFELWVEALREHAKARLKAGETIPGWSLKPARANRTWNNKTKVLKEAKKKFGDDAFTTPELLSPAQMEKLPGGKEWVKTRATSVSHGVTLAPTESAKRVKSRIDQAFGDK